MKGQIDAWGDYDTLSKAVRAYFVQLVDCSPGYYNIARQNIRAFFNWCVKHGILSKNPAGFLKKRRDDPKIRCVDMEDLKKFLALPDRNTYAGLRDVERSTLPLQVCSSLLHSQEPVLKCPWE